MKSKKGFTLVELLASVVILSLIIILSISSYTRIVKSIREKSASEMFNRIKKAAENYTADTNKEVFFVQDLIENGNLEDEEDLLHPLDKKQRINCYPIKVDFIKGAYVATIFDTAHQKDDKSCDEEKLAELNLSFGFNVIMLSEKNYRLNINCSGSQTKVIVVSNRGHNLPISSCGKLFFDVTVNYFPITFTVAIRSDKNYIDSRSITLNEV